MEPYKESFVKFLVTNGALAFGDFVTKSGRKSPYFINTGVFHSGLLVRELGDYYARAIVDYGIEADTLFGPAYKGIPLVVATAISLKTLFDRDVSFAFNRKEIKDHGEGGGTAGKPLRLAEKILIIDDVLTAGTSVKESLMIFRDFQHLNIKGTLISVDRQEKHFQVGISEVSDFRKYSIVTIDDIVSILYNREIDGTVYINGELKEKINRYRELYGA